MKHPPTKRTRSNMAACRQPFTVPANFSDSLFPTSHLLLDCKAQNVKDD